MRALLPLRPPRIPVPKQVATAPTIHPRLVLILDRAGRRPLCARRPTSSSAALSTTSSWVQAHAFLLRQAREFATSAHLFRPLVGEPEPQYTIMAPYEETLKGKYPGKLHAKRVADYIRSKLPGATTGVIYLEGGKTRMIENCDQEEHFR